MKVKLALLVFVLLFITAPIYASPVQNFSFTDIDGITYAWPGMKGVPIVVNIGSHW